MTPAAISVRTLGALSAGLLALGMLAACTPEPAPKPTKTALFPSDAEAFKAAEETYRAYTDAGNAHRRGEKQDPKDYLTGLALRHFVDDQRQFEEAGFSLEGDITVGSFAGKPGSVKRHGERLSAIVCLDISKTTRHSDSDAVLPERPPVVAQEVEMIWLHDAYRISDEVETDATSCGS